MLVEIRRCFCSMCFYEGPICPMAFIRCKPDDTYFIEHRCPACNSLIRRAGSVMITTNIDARSGTFLGGTWEVSDDV